MRSHDQIVVDAGKDADIAAKLCVNTHQVRDWRLRKSIPPEHWMAFETNGFATLVELAEAAARRAAA